MQLIGLIATGNVRALDGNGELIDIEQCTAIELEDKLRQVCLDDLREWFHECRPKHDHITISARDFSGVANCITEQPPKWLPVALAYYAKWLPTEGNVVDISNIVDRLQCAVKDMEQWLPIWDQMAFDIKCPPDIKIIMSALPGLKKELDRLNGRGPGLPLNMNQETCAAIIVECWRLIHGKPQPRSEKLYSACKEYWRALGGGERGKENDIDNWQRSVRRAIDADHKWIRDPLTAISISSE